MNRNTHFIVLIALVSFFSCKNSPSLLSETEGDYALVIEYETQTMSYQDNLGNTDTTQLSTLDMLSSIPNVSKEHVKIYIKDDGSSKWEIDILEPDWEYEQLPSIVEGTDQEVKHKVLKDDKAYYFNEENKLLFTHSIETPNFKELLHAYKQIKKPEDKYSFKKGEFKADNIFGNIQVTEESYEDQELGQVFEKVYFDTVKSCLIKRELFSSVNDLICKDSMSYVEIAPHSFIPAETYITAYYVNQYGKPYEWKQKIDYLTYQATPNF